MKWLSDTEVHLKKIKMLKSVPCKFELNWIKLYIQTIFEQQSLVFKATLVSFLEECYTPFPMDNFVNCFSLFPLTWAKGSR